MTDHGDLLYLAYIDEAAKGVEDTVVLHGRSSLEDALVRDATMYRMQTLAESTQRPSPAFKDQHPDIPWRQLVGFRNQLAHGYLGVDLDIGGELSSMIFPSSRSACGRNSRYGSNAANEEARLWEAPQYALVPA